MEQASDPSSPAELKALVRRLVRQELLRLLSTPVESILEDWRQEGPDDPAEDEALLREALGVLQKYGNKPDA